jgi:catecholate siderophore receptor
MAAAYPATVIIAVHLLCAGVLPATSASPALQGRILDRSRSPIAGARVTARRGDVAAPTALSDARGEFFLSVDSGPYTLEVAADGFAPWQAPVIVLESGARLDDIVLEIETVKDTVTVTESSGYQADVVRSGTKTLTPLRDLPQSVSVVTNELIKDQVMLSVGDVVRYVPGITAIQGENNRDQVVIRGNSSSADFYLNGVRDDVQYYRDLYNIDDVEALKGPNAMVFGRGGGGGVINRVTKEAGFTPLREVTLVGGSFGEKRVSTDLNQPLNDRAALRLAGVFEDADSFRRHVGLQRYAFNPTLTLQPEDKTRIVLGYEKLRDDRVADRGIPSFQGRPLDVDPATYFGVPDESHVGARVNIGTVAVERQFGLLDLRSHTLIGDYDRGYQNFVPGAVTADALQYSLSGYNNATRRRNIFEQVDATRGFTTGAVRHTLTGGFELGRQATGNFRNTAYFNNTATSILVPLADPALDVPVAFRQSATDADNQVYTYVGATYLQDQVAVNRWLQVIAGLRFDHFDLRFHNNRTAEDLRRIDNMASPRAGVVVKPVDSLSLYANYSVSFLPSSGDQFSSLTPITQQVKPEQFTNYEAGAKWDATRRLSLTFAAYRLDRTNTRSIDPNDPTRIVQTGSQRTNGYEVGWNGSVTRAWRIAGGYAFQDAFVTSATTAARAGAVVAQVPRHTFSFWNQYQASKRVGLGLGVVSRSNMFAAIDNTVVLPGYARIDGAVFYSVTERIRLQGNAENLFDRRYILNADNNTNISPGSTRAIRIALIARF